VTSEKTSRLKFAVEAVEMRLKVFQPLFQPLRLISTAVESNRISTASTVILCYMVKVKVTSLYMPQRASQRKLGKSLQPNLCKQRGGDYDKKEKGTEKGLGWRRIGESRMAEELAEKGLD